MLNTKDREAVYLTADQVRARYGGRSEMWIYRLLANPESAFPRPTKLGGGRLRYWLLADLVAWERQAAARVPAEPAAA